MKKKTPAGRSGGLTTRVKRNNMTGGRGGGRPRTSRAPGREPLLGRLRRLELLVTWYIDPKRGGLTDAEAAGIISAIRDSHGGSEGRREAMEVPAEREGQGNLPAGVRWPRRQPSEADTEEEFETTLGEHFGSED